MVVADTMDLWINIQRDELLELFKRIDGLVLNDSEARLLTGEENLVRAGQEVRKLGPKFVVVKKGEHGAMFFGENETYVMPAYPTPDVIDPTGAGDSFAGGMMGYLAEQKKFDPLTLKTALAYGTLVASFTVEDFSLERMKKIERPDLERRMQDIAACSVFDPWQKRLTARRRISFINRRTAGPSCNAACGRSSPLKFRPKFGRARRA